MHKIRRVITLIESSRITGKLFLKGISKYVQLHGPWSFYRPAPFFVSPKNEQTLTNEMLKWEPDGIVLRDNHPYEEFFEKGIPFVVLRTGIKSIKNFNCVQTNCVSISEMAIDHFLDRNYSNFAFCGYESIPWSEERQQAYCERLTQEGIAVSVFESKIPKSKYVWETEQQRMANWLKTLPKPTALFACNDDRAQDVVEACKIADVHIPEDIAILGVDNDELVCTFSNPALSSINLNFENAGFKAAQLLDRMMSGEIINNQPILVEPTHIATRTSSDMNCMSNPEVAQAATFIRFNANKAIRVDDVVKASGLSRRVLEKRFRKNLGRTIHQEIRHARVNQIIERLAETNMSITEIAKTLEFSGVDHIARFFRKEKDMTLMEYRKKYCLC